MYNCIHDHAFCVRKSCRTRFNVRQPFLVQRAKSSALFKITRSLKRVSLLSPMRIMAVFSCHLGRLVLFQSSRQRSSFMLFSKASFPSPRCSSRHRRKAERHSSPVLSSRLSRHAPSVKSPANCSSVSSSRRRALRRTEPRPRDFPCPILKQMSSPSAPREKTSSRAPSSSGRRFLKRIEPEKCAPAAIGRISCVPLTTLSRSGSSRHESALAF